MSQRFRLTPYQPKVLEKHVVEACTQFLNLRGYLTIRIPSGRYWTIDKKRMVSFPAGLPDYCAIHGEHRSFFIEFKRERGGVVSDAQERKHQQLEAFRLIVLVCSSLEDLAAWLPQHEGRARGP